MIVRKCPKRGLENVSLVATFDGGQIRVNGFPAKKERIESSRYMQHLVDASMVLIN